MNKKSFESAIYCVIIYNMRLRDKIISIFDRGEVRFKNYNSLITTISKQTGESFENVSSCLNSLLNEGIIFESGKKSLAKAKDLDIFVGKIVGNSKGFAFVKSSSKQFEDYFIPAKNLHGALDGDTVMFKIEKDDVAEVVKILKRGNSRLTGEVVANDKKTLKGKFVVPTNSKFSRDIFVSEKELAGAKVGDKVVVELTFMPEKNENPVGRVVKILCGNEKEIAIENVLSEGQIPKDFSKETILEVEKLDANIGDELKKRRDLRDKVIFTIDGEDAKDLDDAISLEKTGEKYILGVHIADVGNFVKRDSLVDKEAFYRATSVYFPETVYPMLPKRLSNNLCSLNADEEKLTLSVLITLDDEANILDYEIFESVIKSAQRLTYTEVFKLFNNEENNIKEEVRKSLLDMKKLSDKVEEKRKQAGALDFDVKESEFVFDENGNVVDVKARERNSAHKLIENFMVLANEVVAQAFVKLDLPFVYRVHHEPIKTKIDEVLKIIETLGAKIKFSKNITPKYIQQILKSIEDEDYYTIASKLILRALEKAIYLPDCDGHFGLALENYCHFTSPIRRYPDLTIHRIIKEVLSKIEGKTIKKSNLNQIKNKIKFDNIYELEEFVYDASTRSSERERMADESERKVDDIYKAMLMKNKVGEFFDGIVSGVTNFGVFVELENSVEGLVKLENLPEDSYNYDEKKMVLAGKNKKFYLGMQTKVQLMAANVIQGKIEFKIVQEKYDKTDLC